MNNFQKIEKIHEGSYGKVYKAKNKLTGQFVDVKSLNLADDYQGLTYDAISAISTLKQLSHPNIVKLLEILLPDMNRRKLILIFEYFSMNLKTYMDSLEHGTFMDPRLVKSYLYQINSAIFYCHQRCIVHRDLMPQNIFINEKGIIKVADVCVTIIFQVPYMLWYTAPETILGCQEYSSSIDMWSIGCIFSEMLTNKPLFPGNCKMGQLFCIFRILKTPTEEMWPDMSSLPNYTPIFPKWITYDLHNHMGNVDDAGFYLLEKMLIYNPELRISAKATLKHRYFINLKLPPGFTIVDID